MIVWNSNVFNVVSKCYVKNEEIRNKHLYNEFKVG